MVSNNVSSLKLVIVGDEGVGKTTLVQKFVYGRYDIASVPTVYDNYAVAYKGANSSYVLSIFDTSGQGQFSALRSLSYITSDVFIVCFSVTSPKSFKSVEAIWTPEIGKFCPGVPFIVVGMQTDLREIAPTNSNDGGSLNLSKDFNVVTENRGRLLAERIGAKCYVECYRDKLDDIKQVFHCAVGAAVENMARESLSSRTTLCSCVVM